MSLHVEANGALSNTWSDGDYLDLLFRQGARVTDGHFMGKPWAHDGQRRSHRQQMWLLRCYNPV